MRNRCDPGARLQPKGRHVGGTARRFGDNINFFNGSVNHAMRYNTTPGVDHGGRKMPGFEGVESWTKEGALGAIVHIFHPDYWGNWLFELESFNATAKSFAFGAGGFQEAHGGLGKSFDRKNPFFVEGVREALNAKGEWWVDKSTSTLYILPNTTDASSSRDGADVLHVIAPRIKTIIGIRGEASDRSATNITLRGLEFAHAAETYLEPYIVPSPGDWSISRNGALFVAGAEDVVVDRCKFYRVGGNGIFLSGKAWRTVVKDSEFHLIGDSAIATVGDLKGNDGVSTDAYLTMHTGQPTPSKILETTGIGNWNNHPVHPPMPLRTQHPPPHPTANSRAESTTHYR